MLTREKFIEQLQRTTGKKFAKDFGFILGTQVPFQVDGAFASSNRDGFILWEKRDGKTVEHNIILDPNTDALILCAKLLMQDWPKFDTDSAKMDHVGEL